MRLSTEQEGQEGQEGEGGKGGKDGNEDGNTASRGELQAWISVAVQVTQGAILEEQFCNRR